MNELQQYIKDRFEGANLEYHGVGDLRDSLKKVSNISPQAWEDIRGEALFDCEDMLDSIKDDENMVFFFKQERALYKAFREWIKAELIEIEAIEEEQFEPEDCCDADKRDKEINGYDELFKFNTGQ